MNNNKLNIDDYTRELISRVKEDQPGKDFTKNVMSRILKDPSVEVSFITKDDKESSLWLILSVAIMFVGSIAFYFFKNGFDFSHIQKPTIFTFFADFFAKFWNEMSLSPYILIALVGVIFLVVIDRTIVKYLYSI